MRLSYFFVLILLSGMAFADARAQEIENLGSFTLKKNWYVGPIDAHSKSGGDKFCAMAGNFDRGTVLAFSRNQHGFASVALEFEKDLFEAGKEYQVTLKIDDEKKPAPYAAKAANPRSLVVQLGADEVFFEGLAPARSISFYFDRYQSSYVLDDFMTGLASLDHCVSTLKKNISDVKLQSNLTPDMAFHQTGADTPSATVGDAKQPPQVVAAPQKAPDDVQTQTNIIPEPKPTRPSVTISLADERKPEKPEVVTQAQPLQKTDVTPQYLDHKPVAVIEAELLKQQADMDRQARILAERAEFLEQERIKIEKQKMQKAPTAPTTIVTVDQAKIDEAKEKIMSLENELAENKLKIATLEKENINKTVIETQHNQKMITDLEGQQKRIAEKIEFLNAEENRIKSEALTLEEKKKIFLSEMAQVEKSRQEIEAKRLALETEKQNLESIEKQKSTALTASAADLKLLETTLDSKQKALQEKEKALIRKELNLSAEQAELKDLKTLRQTLETERLAFATEQQKLKDLKAQIEMQAPKAQATEVAEISEPLKAQLMQRQSLLDKREAELLMREQNLMNAEQKLKQESAYAAPSQAELVSKPDFTKVISVQSEDAALPSEQEQISAPSTSYPDSAEVDENTSAISNFLDNIIVNHHGGAR